MEEVESNDVVEGVNEILHSVSTVPRNTKRAEEIFTHNTKGKMAESHHEHLGKFCICLIRVVVIVGISRRRVVTTIVVGSTTLENSRCK